MLPLIVLLVTFILAALLQRLVRRNTNLALAARVAMSVMLVFTAIGHFLYSKGMALMIPGIIPYKNEVILATGVLEIVAAIMLLVPATQKLTAWFLVLYFILVLPSNIYAAMHHINYQKATFDGPGPAYLWFRVPLQVLFIYWVYFSAIKVITQKQQASKESLNRVKIVQPRQNSATGGKD